MSSPSQALHPPAPAATPDLGSLRAELDRLDDALHDTLMRRAEVVAQVAALRVKGPVPLRPGREAAIIRRLLARHGGALPVSGVVRIWRELLAATTAQQRPLLVAIGQAGNPTYLALAREHFGALTPLRAYQALAQATDAVRAGVATVAVLPMPMPGEATSAAWWPAMLHQGGPCIHVVARLPFWMPRPEGSPDVQALVVSAAAPDPSGWDRSLLGLELTLETSAARLDAALAAAGFRAGTTILRRTPGAAGEQPTAQALVDVEGFVGDDDARLAGLQAVRRPPVVLGAYAVPLDGEC